MNTNKEAASPLLTGHPMPSGSGVRRAMLRGRWCGQARACPGDRRGTPITTYRQDQKAQNYMIEVSTVSFLKGRGRSTPFAGEFVTGSSGFPVR